MQTSNFSRICSQQDGFGSSSVSIALRARGGTGGEPTRPWPPAGDAEDGRGHLPGKVSRRSWTTWTPGGFTRTWGKIPSSFVGRLRANSVTGAWWPNGWRSTWE